MIRPKLNEASQAINSCLNFNQVTMCYTLFTSFYDVLQMQIFIGKILNFVLNRLCSM